LVALIPIAVMFSLLGVFRRPAHIAAGSGLATALVLAVLVWGMPTRLAVSASLLGAAVALVPLVWTLVAAVWFINVLTHGGHFDVVKRSLAALTPDRRVQALLVGYGFIGLLEGLVAMGSPAAIGAALLAGFGFPPLTASLVALVSFSHPGIWGPMGIPVTVLSDVTRIDVDALGAMIGRQDPWLTLVCAPVVVWLVAGWKGLRGVWPLALVSGSAFAAVSFLTSNFLTFYVAGAAGALAAILATVAGIKIWSPVTVWRFENEGPASPATDGGLAFGEVLRSWAPIALLLVLLGVANGTALRDVLASLGTVRMAWPGLHDVVLRLPPIVAEPVPYAAGYVQPLLVLPGTVVLIGGLLSLPLIGMRVGRAMRIYASTVRQLRVAILTTMAVIALGYVMNYGGLSPSLGIALAVAGPAFPLVAVLVGMIGNAVTGTNTASNALFGGLITVVGEQASAPPAFAASTLAVGGSMAKAIAPQSLALATGATGMGGTEGELLRRLVGVVLLLCASFAAYAMAQYYLFPWTIPTP
jgi:L-lactate transport